MAVSRRSTRFETGLHARVAVLALAAVLCAGCDGIGTDGSEKRIGEYDRHYQIVYRRADGIYTINSDGTENRQVLPKRAHVQDPVWTADGQHLVFVSFRPEASQIFIMSADGSGKRQLTDHPGGSRKPRCSPTDPDRCFYKALNDLEDGGSSLRLLSTDGSLDRPLAQNPPSSMDSGSWSKEGQRIVFAAFANTERNGKDLFVVEADGGEPERLTARPASAYGPHFSPDGSRIVFRSSSGPGKNQDIFVMDADGSDRVNLTKNSAWDAEPTFSPDGTRLAFISDRDGDIDPYIMKSDGTNPRPLVDDRLKSFYHPAWSPDGTRIVYGVDTDQNGAQDTIYIHDLETGTRFELTGGFAPRWAPTPLGQ